MNPNLPNSFRTGPDIRELLKVILQMSVVLTFAASSPARMANSSRSPKRVRSISR